MYYATSLGEGGVIVTILALLMLFKKFRNWNYALTAFFTNIIPFLTEQVLKTFFYRPRPLSLYHYRYWVHIGQDWPSLFTRSFPSGHSEGAFSLLCFLSFLLPEGYRKFGFLFFLIALSVCYSRIYLGAHFFEDVYVGSIIGMVFSTFIYSFMSLKYKVV